MKHYCVDDRVTFVFSINAEQLQRTIKRYYGKEFSESRYLDRFFDLRMSLPQANLQKYLQGIKFTDSLYTFDKVCHIVIDYYRFELREIARFVQMAKIAAYKPTRDNNYNFPFSDGKAIQFALIFIIPIMIGLRIYDENVYTDFVSGKNSTPLLEIFRKDDGDYFNISQLLNRNESYSNENLSKDDVCVKAENKINEVYHALFVQDYSQSTRELHIGSLKFTIETRNNIMRTVSLLSGFADYSF